MRLDSLRIALAGAVLCALALGLLPVAASGSAPQAVDPLSKIDPWVLKTTENGASTSFLVMLTRQADTSGAAAFADKAQRGQYVYEQLTRVAAESQGPLMAFLDERQVPYRSYWIVNLLSVAQGDRALALELAARPDVARIGANPTVKVDLPTPEEMEANEAAVREALQTIEWGIQNTNAPGVWALGYDGSGIVVAGEDTGVRWTHTQLRAKYRGWNGSTADHNYNWWDAIHTGGGICGPNSPQPCDDGNHGSHTMGTMVGGDGAGPDVNDIGMAYGAKWIGCRNMDQGNGTPTTYIECHQFMLAPTNLNGQNPNPALAPHVINNSWVCLVSEGCTDPNVLRTSVENLVNAGIVYVAVAANTGPNCSTVTSPPAIYAASFTVAAHDVANTLAIFSSRGPVDIDGSNRRKPDISGPGVNVRSSRGVGDDEYSIASGTSMAAPHISGAVALLLDARPQLIGQVQQIINALEQTANASLAVVNGETTCGGIPYTTIPNNHFGYGRVDVLAAINAVPQQTPTPTGTGPATATSTPAGNYATCPTTGTIVPGVTDVGNHCDDCVTTVTLPFPVMLYDQTFSTSITVSSNGPLQFSSAISPFTNACLPNASHNNTIFGYWDDLRTDGGGQGIFTTVVGSAPNRTFVIEWRAGYFSGGGSANFEVLLHENSPDFETVYGTVSQGNSSATVGVQRDTGSRFTEYACNGSGGAITSGLQLNFRSGGCATPTPTVTGTPPTATATPSPSPTASCPPPTWLPGAVVPVGIARYAFAQTANELYVLSGVTTNGQLSNGTYRYDAATNSWTALAAVPIAGEAPTAALYQGRIYVAGGFPNTALQIYDIAANSWTAGAPMPTGTYGAAGGAWNGRVFILGGTTGSGSNVTQLYDIATNSWTIGSPMPVSYYLGGYTQAGQYIYVVGSSGVNPLAGASGPAGALHGATGRVPDPDPNGTATLRLDLATSAWSTGPVWSPQRADFALALYGSRLYAMGGDLTGGTFSDPSNLVNELDLSAWPGGSWVASTPNLPSPRQANQAGFTSSARAGGEIWSTGGYISGTYLDEHLYRRHGPCVTPTPAPTATSTSMSPTATNTSAPPTATNTSAPPTATGTSAPPTATSTSAPPTDTPTAGPSPTPTVAPAFRLYLPAIFYNHPAP
jgi:subtilisin family serine protease